MLHVSKQGLRQSKIKKKKKRHKTRMRTEIEDNKEKQLPNTQTAVILKNKS